MGQVLHVGDSGGGGAAAGGAGGSSCGLETTHDDVKSFVPPAQTERSEIKRALFKRQ